MATKTKETTREKGQRLADEGRVEYAGKDERHEPNWMVHGDSGSYRVAVRGVFLSCPCPSRKGDCSHVEAVEAHRRAEMRAAFEEEQKREDGFRSQLDAEIEVFGERISRMFGEDEEPFGEDAGAALAAQGTLF